MQQHSSQTGFTLIELTCVIAIVSLLALLSYSSYQDSVAKARRSQGRVALMLVMQQQERFFSLHNRFQAYANTSDNASSEFKHFSGESAALSAYRIEARACHDETLQTCVEVVAIPTGSETASLVGSQFQDPLCGILTLNSKGEKTAAGLPSETAPAPCW